MRPFRSGLSCPVESGCPVSLRQRLGDEELDECVGAEDGLPRSEDGVGLSDFPRLMRLWPGMNTAVDPSAAVFTAGVVEVELLADVTPEGEDEAEVDGDETSGGESASSSESKGSEGSTASSLASSTPSTELRIPAALSISASKSKTPSVADIGLLLPILLPLLNRRRYPGRLKEVVVNEKSQESIVPWTMDAGRPRRS